MSWQAWCSALPKAVALAWRGPSAAISRSSSSSAGRGAALSSSAACLSWAASRL